MTLDFEQEYDRDLGLDYEELAIKVANAALDCEKCPYEAEIGLTLVDDNAIREINRQFRGTDKPTDVLSFPLVDYEAAGEFDFLEERDDCFNPESGELMLGDIIVSLDRVEAQAKEYGHGARREYAFLIAHSMLHLMGYDHMEAGEAAIMEKKQEAVLQSLGITR
ncbi:MAG: rRNA maturation RNase YbeY [Butyrivibrio sp.]|nr:rRNA maturation RNase YbeY [Butyrivibrio sp.]